MKYYLAIDIGASSGRHIIGWSERGKTMTDEVYRFQNGVCHENNHLVWDVERLCDEVICGIKAAFQKYESIESLSIDTWGVDYVLLNGDEPIYPCYAYRDDRTRKAANSVHEILPFKTLYERTGIQFQYFNTVYQLYDDLQNGRLENATDFLNIPEYIMYRLCGVKAKEFTNATTGALVNVKTGEFDKYIINALRLPEKLFPKLRKSGEILGELTPDIAKKVGGNCKVMLCPTHDTASAVEGIPMNEDGIFLSSGTWSLVGVKLDDPITSEKSMEHNFTNEGGVGYVRYLKNIMGLWIIQNLQKQLSVSFDDMVKMAQKSQVVKIFDVNDSRFSAPENMKSEIIDELGYDDLTDGDIINCVYHSLAFSYKSAIDEIEELTKRKYDILYIAGGGAKNKYLNELTEKYCKKRVIALPIEATALGNLKSQMEADK